MTGGAVGGVDHQDGDVGAVERIEAAKHRVGFEPGFGAGAFTHARGVDEANQSGARLDDGVDGVARRAGHVVHHRAFLADELVKEGGLADVGTPDDGHAQCAVFFLAALFGALFTEFVDDAIE